MSENRRNEIVFATLELASEKGLGTVSMQQIADKVGITKASLYNHFSSREEIVDAMYEVIRQSTKDRMSIGAVDYEGLASSGSMEEVLSKSVMSYKSMVRDPKLNLFYRVIISERATDPKAAEIMVRETETMIDATKRLLLALQSKGKASFFDVDAAAFSFAMAVHSIIDLEFDLTAAGRALKEDMLSDYIDEFCRIYSA